MDKSREKMLIALRKLVGNRFRYAFKSPDMDLFDLGFGEDVNFTNCLGFNQTACRYVVHFTCGIRLFWKDGRKYEYGPITGSNTFSLAVEPLIGTTVVRIAVSEKNDLWIDLGLCSMVIITFEDYYESWRFFSPGTDEPHLVVSGQNFYEEKTNY